MSITELEKMQKKALQIIKVQVHFSYKERLKFFRNGKRDGNF